MFILRVVFIKKDINKILLFLLIVPLILYVSSSVYYENKLNNISNEYREKLGEVTGKAAIGNVNESTRLKETFQKDRESFEKQYSDLRIENDDLKSEKDKLQTELNSVKSELENTKANFDKLQSRFKEAQNGLIKAYEDISSLQRRIKELCSELKSAGVNDERC